MARVLDIVRRGRDFMVGRARIRNRELAAERGIPVYAAKSMEDPRLGEWIEHRRADVLVVYRVPILPESVFARTRFAINLHPSLLPAYRGGHPLLWTIWDDCNVTGCTVHLITTELDRGPIIAQREFAIPPGIHEYELERLVELDIGVAMLRQACWDLVTGRAEIREQPSESPTPLAKRCSKIDVYRQIPFAEWPAPRVWRVLRFLDLVPPQLGARGRLSWTVGEIDERPAPLPPGRIGRDWRGRYLSARGGRVRLRRRLRLN